MHESNLGKLKLLCLKDGQMFSEHVLKGQFHPEYWRPRQISNTGENFLFLFAVGKTNKHFGDPNSSASRSSKIKNLALLYKQ